MSQMHPVWILIPRNPKEDNAGIVFYDKALADFTNAKVWGNDGIVIPGFVNSLTLDQQHELQREACEAYEASKKP